MNALSTPAPVVVVGTIWLDGSDSDPPTMELRLSNGAYTKIGFDTTYWHRLLWWAPNKEADYVSATTEMTGLEPDVLNVYCEQAEQAVRAHESNQRSEWLDDAMSVEDGR